MKTVVKALFVVMALALGGAALSQGGTVLIYTSVPQDVIDVLQAAYERDNPGYSLDVFRGGTSEILTRVSAERQAGAIAADLIWVADPSEIIALKEEGLLLEHVSPETEALPADFRDPDNQYFAGRVLGIVIAYNTLMVDEENRPRGWGDLLEPRFEGQTGFPTPANSGASVVTIAALLGSPEFGEAFIASLGENGMRQLRNNGEAAQLTATGEIQAAVGLDFQIRALKEQGSPIDYVYPADGGVFIPSPIAIFNTSQNQETARHFVDYILSRQGQEILVQEANFIPARDDVQGPEGAPSPDLARLDIDPDFIAQNRERILEVFESNIRP
ncbi:MAG: ABC transporter substrate-binding protein [Deinococcota bacterium]|nr:ABC transporter substrate-binding protein [Deinococcota bacterium]